MPRKQMHRLTTSMRIHPTLRNMAGILAAEMSLALGETISESDAIFINLAEHRPDLLEQIRKNFPEAFDDVVEERLERWMKRGQ